MKFKVGVLYSGVSIEYKAFDSQESADKFIRSYRSRGWTAWNAGDRRYRKLETQIKGSNV